MKNKKITFTTVVIAFGCLGFLSQIKAVTPAPDGCYPGFTTAEGCDALKTLTSGAGNTGVGWRSLFFNSTGSFNTGVGAGALILNNGDSNTAVGAAALLLNVSGMNNTAVGSLALENSTGAYNTALGANAGTDPGIGSNNVYIGDLGFGGDTNVISIGGITASGTPYQNTYIGGIYGQAVNSGTARLVYVDTDGHLGTSPVNASGKNVRMRSPHAAQPEASLNDFQKQQKRIAELENTVARLAATVKEQAAQIQRVSAQLQATRPAPQIVTNP